MSTDSFPLTFNTGLRPNLRLWPLNEVTPATRALAEWDGKVFDQTSFSARIKELQVEAAGAPNGQQESKVANTTRAARDADLICRVAGLSYVVVQGSQEVLKHTPLGRTIFSFLGLTPGATPFANDGNLRLIARPYIQAAVSVRQYRAILQVMLALDGKITNDELNRAMAGLENGFPVHAIGRHLLRYRHEGELPPWRPEKAYPRPKTTAAADEADGDEDTGENEELMQTAPPEGDSSSEEAPAGTMLSASDVGNKERTAMNPHLLIAGGGGLYIDFTHKEERTLKSWVMPIIERALEYPIRELFDASIIKPTSQKLQALMIPGRRLSAQAAAVAIRRSQLAGLPQT